ncbi:extracellular calcium-sensing receptor-like [Xenopus laevis]|uniref:Extracellular calcium-sensing receptor-like n=1 Tax=Xenopus laevis TaxID=8355 RepID=A0A8J1MIM0_XENLA|nr:extracellular calcium-sensing receptor-like [Xenopus laevis]
MILVDMQLPYSFIWLIYFMVWVLSIIIVEEVSASSDSKISCRLPSENITGYLSQEGDIIMGGTFTVHSDRVNRDIDFTVKPPDIQCQRFAVEYYQTMRALIFAVEEINADPELLPNISLGFQIFDTCKTLRSAAQGTLSMLSGKTEITPNYHCYKGAPLAGIIGDAGSTRSILMAQILGLYRYPQISYFATNPTLSNRVLFPSFFRTIPSDEFQMRGLAQLIFHFGWSWVGLLANDDDYGQYGLQMAKQEIINGGACVAFTENILTGQSNRNAPHIVRVIKEATAKVVVAITFDSDFMIVVEEMLRQNLTGHIWIASESWATSVLLCNDRFNIVLAGTIGFAIHGGKMPNFTKYLNNLHPVKYLYDSLILEYWEQIFSCKWYSQNSLVNHRNNDSIKICTGNEKLESPLPDEDHRLSLNVYIAAYAMAWALQSLLHCTPGDGPFHKGACANISSFYPWHLFHYIKNVNFKSKNGRQVFFDARGNPPAIYDIVNWHLSAEGTLEQITVGSYDFSAADGKTLSIEDADIVWTNSKTQVPFSKCSPSCPSGFHKVILPGKPPCCYECARCPLGHIANQTDSVECHPCSWVMWPNLQQDRCLPRPTEFLSYEEPLGYTLAAISLLSSLIPLSILVVFICSKKTPIVRANNYSLSCLLLLSLFLCFLCSLGFIGYPQPKQCLLSQVAFGMIFDLCISCVLAKTITVVIAFTATRPGSKLRQWTGVKSSYSIIILSSFIQLCICGMWLIVSPPFSELDTNSKPGLIIVNCNEGSPIAFWCMLGYLGLLASVSFIVAFLARRLPDSFNEAKFITFSMLAFLSVWVSFIPAYLSARGMYTVAMEVFAILSSSWAMVVCIFVPKCYIVLFRPNMNSREHLTIKSRGAT